MANWFGNLNLAYKYTIVFVSLLLLTILAGLIKVFFDRRKLKKVTEKIKGEEEARDDRVELNHREKDEGDLFGVRAIEAGFYAGIPQSRPTSRAGSIAGSPSMSSSTLLGGFNSPKVQSMASSVTELPLAHINNRDSDVLPSNSPPHRRSPSALRLEPSEAELTGSHNHNGAVNMGLIVPPSPDFAQSPRSSTMDPADDSDHSSRTSALSGARSAVVTTPGDTTRSQAASFMSASPNNSRPPSPGQHKQTIQAASARDKTGSPHEVYVPAHPESSTPSGPTIIIPSTPSEPEHRRERSDGSSVYSDQRNSKHASMANRQSMVRGSFLAPIPVHDMNDPRFSEFYDVYFRTSQLVEAGPRQPEQLSTEPVMTEDGSSLHSYVHAR